jgi:hypothetical protein
MPPVTGRLSDDDFLIERAIPAVSDLVAGEVPISRGLIQLLYKSSYIRVYLVYYFSNIGINTYFRNVGNFTFLNQIRLGKDQRPYPIAAPSERGSGSEVRVFEASEFSFCIGSIQFLN